MASIKMNRGEEYVLTLKQLKRKYPEGEASNVINIVRMLEPSFIRRIFPQTRSSKHRPPLDVKMFFQVGRNFQFKEKYAAHLQRLVSFIFL